MSSLVGDSSRHDCTEFSRVATCRPQHARPTYGAARFDPRSSRAADRFSQPVPSRISSRRANLSAALVRCPCSNQSKVLISVRSEIVARYTLLLSHTHSIASQLVPPPPSGAEDETQGWQKTLANVVVHPGQAVDEDKDFLVGVLLRTRQVCSFSIYAVYCLTKV